MIDGVKCVCKGFAPAAWAAVPLLDFGVTVSETTGEIVSTKREAERDGLTFRTRGDYCQMFGSLHSFKNRGGTNADTFTFDDLQKVLGTLQRDYKINPFATYIQHLEIGVNISLEYSPDIVIKSAISHKGRGFYPIYDRRHHKIGKSCEYEDYAIKLYNKGKQDGTRANILRFEYVARRARVLAPCGVRTLADLSDRSKCARLLGLLLSVVPGIVFYDFKYKGAGMTPAQFEKFRQYSNPYYWENLTKFARVKAFPRYLEKVAKFGLIDWQKWLYNKTTKTGALLLGCKPENGGFFHSDFTPCKQNGLATFSTLECSLEKVATTTGRGNLVEAETATPEMQANLPYNPATENRRFCVVCGREITGQKSNSRFCSERLYGKYAKKCRNKDSNRRLTIKRKIIRAMKNDKFLIVTYEENGVLWSDILHPSEISITRAWLDKVRTVETTDQPPKRLKGAKAREYMKQFQPKEERQ